MKEPNENVSGGTVKLMNSIGLQRHLELDSILITATIYHTNAIMRLIRESISHLVHTIFVNLTVAIDEFECCLLLARQTDEFFSPMGATYYLDYGIDIGYETDQAFRAKNRTISAFVFAAYEDFRRNTFLGINSIKPALRLAIDTIAPSSETPRAIVGDDSQYQRLSGEFSLVVPLTRLAQLPYSFTFSFRTYKELSASQIVKQSDLDRYHLRTYSLNTPNGLFVSYSSGKLPFGVNEENTVALGYQTYF